MKEDIYEKKMTKEKKRSRFLIVRSVLPEVIVQLARALSISVLSVLVSENSQIPLQISLSSHHSTRSSSLSLSLSLSIRSQDPKTDVTT